MILPPENRPTVSAVIIAYQGVRFIPDCLRTVAAELADYRHEIIVVDNYSTDGTREFIETRYPEVKLIRNERNEGFARAVNQGIKASQYEYVWLLNQDIRIRPGCLATLVDFYRRADRPGVVGPRYLGFDGRLQLSCRRFPRYHHLLSELSGLAYLFKKSLLFNGWKMGDFDHLSSREVEQPMGAVMLIHRDRFAQVGLLDETFPMFFNDVDFCRRLSAAGFKNYYCFDAVVEHYVGGSVSRHKPRMVWLAHRAMYRYFVKVERERGGGRISKVLRFPFPHLAGLLLYLAAIPRSLYHLIRKLI